MKVNSLFKSALIVIFNCAGVLSIFLFRQFSILEMNTAKVSEFSVFDLFQNGNRDFNILKAFGIMSIVFAVISILLFVFKSFKAGFLSSFVIALCEIVMLFLIIFGAAGGNSAEIFTFANSNAFLPMLLSMLSSMISLIWCCGKNN